MPDILEKYFSEQVFSNKTILFILAKQYCFLINFRLHPTAEAGWGMYFFEYRQPSLLRLQIFRKLAV